MNFAPFNVLEFDGALPSVSIASWLPIFTQPGRLAIYAVGTTLTSVQVVKTVPRTPDPWRATSTPPGPAPRKGVVIREPAGIVSSPPIFSYIAPPALPNNAGYTIVPVPDPWRGTSTPLYGPQKPFIIPEFLSWQPIFVQPGRPILRVPGTVHVKDDWRFPEAVSADKWQPTIVQAARPILRAAGTTSVDRLLEIVFADKWQPVVVQPTRMIARAAGTDLVTPSYDPTHADPRGSTWSPTIVQPTRSIIYAKGTDHVEIFVVPFGADETYVACNGRLTLTSGDPIDASATGTTLYFTPYAGNTIGLYDGSSQWNVIPFVETSVGVPGGTGVYDVFAYNNAGTMALETLAWSTTTARATNIVLQSGIYVKSGATTRRYLGTIYSVSGTCSDTYDFRYVWNYYNRLPKRLFHNEASVSWNPASSWGMANANTNNCIKLVVGVKESLTYVLSSSSMTTADAVNYGASGIGYDVTNSTISDMSYMVGQISALRISVISSVFHLTDIGLHTYNWLEWVATAATWTSSHGTGGSANLAVTGISGSFPC